MRNTKDTENIESTENIENIKIAVGIRMARAAMGISQLELAELLGISKITIARVETLESSLRADVYLNALKVLRGYGVILNTMETTALQVDVSNAALRAALARLNDSSKRRVDKKIKPA